jgi:hypothetical protein
MTKFCIFGYGAKYFLVILDTGINLPGSFLVMLLIRYQDTVFIINI